MILTDTLKYLSSQKAKDAEILLRNRRNNGAIYLMGYALEFSLKRKISLTLGFTRGFPETSAELNTYPHQTNSLHPPHSGAPIIKLGNLKHHRLNELLIYSGVYPRIISLYSEEWRTVIQWSIEGDCLTLSK
jgi:hypothetical protein